MKTTICRTRCGALGLCLLQGFFGFIAVSYAGHITVSKSGPADYSSITAAYQSMVNTTGGTLTENWTIEVLDDGIYDETLGIWKLGTSSQSRLTITSSPGKKPTIKPTAKGAAAVIICATDFVTISGFVLQNTPDPHPINVKAALPMTVIEDDRLQAPTESQVTWDNCEWDGQDQEYNVKGLLLCWHPHCNITVRDSIFHNAVIETDDALITLGPRVNNMTQSPSFEFINNIVRNNSAPLLDLFGNPTAGYYNSIVLQGNTFSDNQSQYDLVTILNQRAGNQIHDNQFYLNTLTRTTLSVINSGNTLITGNWFLQNGASAEVLLHDSSKATITLTGNTLAASPGNPFCVSASMTGKAVLQSYGNLFYSNYNTKDSWNTPRTDLVAVWGGLLRIDQWNKKTGKDGNDSLAPLGVLPPAPPF